tara:strand:- start:2260 stop:2484 length:225 start_codon:yes stop_codon:yes gene_type:complete
MGFKGDTVVTGDIPLGKIKALQGLPEFTEEELNYLLKTLAASTVNVAEIETAYSSILKFQQLILYYRKLKTLKQ